MRSLGCGDEREQACDLGSVRRSCGGGSLCARVSLGLDQGDLCLCTGIRLLVWGRAMGSTDYTSAILVMTAVALALTGMVVYVVTRPTDLGK